MNEFFTWELLATYSGACVATGILVEFLKGLLPGLPPRLLSYHTAAAILLAAQLFTGTLTLSGGMLSLLNAVLGSLAGGGAECMPACTAASTSARQDT